MKKLKVIDLFAGAGGLSYGFEKNGNFEVVAANEILEAPAKAYSLNFPNCKVYDKDIKEFSAKDIEKDLGIRASEIDIVIGGPPCQAYSTVGKRLMSDPRATLFQEYHRLLKEFKPTFFLFENVKGLLSMQKGDLLKAIIDDFESLGYSVQYKILNAADYGVPQLRERVVIIGTKHKKPFVYPEPTHSQKSKQGKLFDFKKPYLSIKDAISDLPLIKSNESSKVYLTEPQNSFQQLMRKNAPKELADHSSPNNNLKLVKIMELLPDGGSPLDLPAELRPSSGFKNTYCRLWWEKPSTTITRNLGTPSSSRCIHPKAPRPLTTREGARLQSFPDDYIFFGSKSAKNLQIGEAVPPLLSIALAEATRLHLLDDGEL
jgi:DNA (cytosine-5)-methyltransferase 1